ncbi:MAG: HAMP domain-containing protein [Gammaproteobacteria bacterium]|nr:HAMP domain-containing protein [Gammaproteobacteria bacterium]MBU1600489.1 HAMP domain-containing protein [Gammaproteobacteria bacterium]MBU2434945.1 HAMP domain-containing protein [Gammaproteobacteria bacterium]MBU2448181.1 HAMP domain-containing protein [Gammaproteobacteria bacterium]
MGRLFWKFFLFIWLGQVAAVVGTGTFFWFERQQSSMRADFEAHRPPPMEFDRGGPPHRPPPPDDKRPGGPLPIFPMIAALIASLLCAAGVAWYFAKPIRHLRNAFATAAEGNLDTRVGGAMGGRRDELADLGQDFDRMAERLQALMAAQKRLLHDVSHEMRSPLARLQAAIGLARQQPGRIEDTLARIEREGERMNGLIGELLTLSRLEAGVSGPLEKVDLGELLAGIVEDARFEGAAEQVGVDFVAAPGLFVQANPELLHRAIENVVRNGLRFSPAGTSLQIGARLEADGLIHLHIADQGSGVPEAELEAIFTPFYRGRNLATGDGYGLGLAIARQVLSTVNGKIAAKMKADGSSGLLIEIVLPAAN